MMNGKWQWDDVRFFLAVSREGSLSGAARALGVDHVTVGRRIALLEKQLSAKLLNRTPDGLITTSAGQVILRECEAMEGAALSLERLVSGQDTRAAGSVRVTANDWLTYSVIVPSIVSFRERYPELQIDLLASIRVLDIALREADLAVRVTFVRPTDPSLVCRRLGNIGYALYASRQYLVNHGTPERGEGLGGHDLISYTGAPGWFGPLYMGESVEGARISMRATNPFVRLKATADGLGISELACFFGDGYPEVIRVWPNEAPALRPVWLISHEDLRRATRIRVVSAAIADAFQRQAKVLRNGHRDHARN